MVAPDVEPVIVTDCADEYVPVPGVKTGVAAFNVYVALATADCP